MTTSPSLPCGCPTGSGRSISDQAVHNAWHALCVEQGGPAGAVTAATLQAARGFGTGTATGETVIDEKARRSGRRASGALREACR